MSVQVKRYNNLIFILIFFLAKDPEYVAVHENSRTSTPKGLTQVRYQRYHSF